MFGVAPRKEIGLMRGTIWNVGESGSSANINVLGCVIRREVNRAREGIIEMREGDVVLDTDLLTNTDLIDI